MENNTTDNKVEEKDNSPWYKRVFLVFKKQEKPVEKQQEPTVQTEMPKGIEDPFVKFKNIPALQVPDYSRITRTIKDHLYETACYFRNLGHHDGVLGIVRPQDIETMAKTYARAFHEEAQSEIGGIKQALENEKQFYSDTLHRAEQEYTEEKKHLDYIKTLYRYSPGSYSTTLFLLYAVVGFCIFIADIPLALELISKGFSYLTSPKFPLANLFFDPLNVFLYNWETFFTAFGIAFITIYIKMYYDDYVATQEAVDIIRRQKLRTMFDDQRAFDYELKVKFIVRTVILVFLFALLIVLAWFRYESSKALNPESVSTSGAIIVFFMITLMLPVVSGICLSLSLKILQNKRHKRRAETSCEIAREKTDEISKQYRDVERRYNIVKEVYEDWIKKTDFKTEATEFYLAYYSNGYNQGLLEPDKYDGVTDFFTRVNMLRSKATAKKLFNIVRNK